MHPADHRQALLQAWIASGIKNGKGFSPPELNHQNLADPGAFRLYRQLWYSFEAVRRALTPMMSQGWNKTDPKLRAVMVLAASEMIWRNFEQAYASVHSWVNVGAKVVSHRSKALLNAVLRRFCDEYADEDHEKFFAERWLPWALRQEWQRSSLGEEQLLTMLQASSRAHLHQIHAEMNDETPSIPWQGGTILLAEGKLAGLETGEAFVQNVSAAQVCWQVTQNLAGGKILDYCAAPGGKSWQISRLQPDIKISMWDGDQERLQMCSKSPMMQQFRKIEVLQKEPQGLWSDVLIDVPCTATGILNKAPEAMRRFSQKDEFSGIQNLILDAASSLIENGGHLHYTTCSICHRENRERIEAFVEKNKSFTFERDLQIWPDARGAHGAYWALLKYKQPT